MLIFRDQKHMLYDHMYMKKLKGKFAHVVMMDDKRHIVKVINIYEKEIQCLYYTHRGWKPMTMHKQHIKKFMPMEKEQHNMHMDYDSFSDNELLKKKTSNEILIATPRGFKQLNNIVTSQGSHMGTVVAPVFPKIQDNWFYTGFPGSLAAGGKNGSLVNFIPITFTAKKSDKFHFILPPLPDRVGYLDMEGKFSESLDFETSFTKGQMLFTLLLKKDDPACKDSLITNSSYWKLMTEFSGIDPGSTASKSISITSGISKIDSFNMGLSIGATIGVKAGLEGIAEVTAEFSEQLSLSFGTSVTVSQQVTTTDTVEFKAQPVEQRIATYQFYENYEIKGAKPLKDKVNYFNNPKYNAIANIATADYVPKAYDYQTRYFRKAFVLQPQK